MRNPALLFICAFLPSCNGSNPASSSATVPPAASSDQDRRVIEAAFERWLEAYESGNPDALASLFTDDAIYAANTGERLTGRAGIRSGVAA